MDDVFGLLIKEKERLR